MMSRFLQLLLPFWIAPVYWILSRTWRINEMGPQGVLSQYVQNKNRGSCVFAHWHGDELVLVAYYSFRKLSVLSSLSKDGSIMALTLRLLGYRVFRGSSSRGGARGLLGLIRSVRSGAQAALAVDGPKGPIHKVKPGVADLAQKTGKPIIPVVCRADRSWPIPNAWNRSYLPMPFARVEVEYGEPILPGPELSIKVQLALDALTRE